MRNIMILCIDGLDPILARDCKLEFLRSIGDIQEIITGKDTGETVSYIFSDNIVDMTEHSNYNIKSHELLWNKINCKWGIGNVPTIPVLKIFGWSIVGYFRPGSYLAYPYYIEDYLRSINYEVDIPVKIGEYLFSHLHYPRIINKRTKAFNYLLKEYPVEIAFLWYRCLDGINHEYCIGPEKNIEKILKWYERLDYEISKLNTKFEKIIIFSDHGVPSYAGIFKRLKDKPHRAKGIFLNNMKYKIKHIRELYYLIEELAKDIKGI